MNFRRLSTLALPLGVVGIILLLVVPLPSELLDFLIATNIVTGLLILLTAMYVKRPLDFSIFPSLLLVATLFRLGLNVASTRLILRDGEAGKVIHAFGDFVVGGSLVIGLVIFTILVVIQFLVITNGAGRVAEVGARFTLEAMPGKQMAIDADLNAGLIDEETARTRRAEVTAEADFYGAMDGGAKFVKGDAIAGIIIILINLIGGFIIGMVQKGLDPAEALHRYSLLTVGDGLVTQIPALLMSVATGLIVTRATSQGDMGTDAAAQLLRHRTALRITGGGAIVIALIPGLPKLPFLVLGAGLLLLAQRVPATETTDKVVDVDAGPVAPTPETPEQLMQQMRVDPLEIVLAPDLVDLVDAASGGDLLDRVRSLRRKIALELGIVLPPVRTRDSLDLPLSTYAVRISGVEVGTGLAPAGKVLALGDHLEGLPGTSTTEPVFGLAGKWVPAELRHQAEMTGATVVDRASVLVTHLAEIVRTNAARLLSREDVKSLTDSLKTTDAAVVDELVPSLLTLGEVQRVLQAMLEEGVPVRDLARIYEGLSLRAKVGTDQASLVEAARAALGPAVAAPHIRDGKLRVLTLDPLLEHQLVESLRVTEVGAQISMDPGRVEAVVEEAARKVRMAEDAGFTPVLVCAPALRAPLRRLVAMSAPAVSVLSYSEVSGPELVIETVGVVHGANAVAA
ncbi:flagellar biosynthesis protein FlhA [Quadrisphaera granulorum]|uniref:Flagellar biosynthesis protein FlhA n=1 Tax=Quadrisphaera granulorum TaxID=317664 RepID=A0A316A4H2_9ACTN|nr:flagellar biosynthesis protein FlhA [Quadrisphaera granulorum]PWJ52575.1 flagellar biosynthesis protein FlhA [Quadrisphaera granulorum]SZE97625.1 flagellar biosynthesis protein FlhA [Quadrisphaera granulorum]